MSDEIESEIVEDVNVSEADSDYIVVDGVTMTTEEYAELMDSEEDELEYDELEEDSIDDEEEYEYPDEHVKQVTEVRNVVVQPYITSVIVAAEVDSKGAIKPACKISIERHLTNDDVEEKDIFDTISNDFEELSKKVSEQLEKLRNETNK